MDYSGKVVLITGGTSGIGFTLAKEFAERNAFVCVVARRKDLLDQAISQLSLIGHGGQVGIVCDVSDLLQVERMVEEVEGLVGTPDILINSAGVALPGYVQELDLEVFDWMMQTNYFGTLHVVKSFLPGMIARRSGKIINFGSLASYVGVFGYSAYSASKFALRGFTEALRFELKPYGIDVSIVIPPDTDTPQLAYENGNKPLELLYLLPELGVIQPEQVANAVLHSLDHYKFEVVPDTGSKAVLLLIRLLGAMIYPIEDWLLNRAARRIQREKSNQNDVQTG